MVGLLLVHSYLALVQVRDQHPVASGVLEEGGVLLDDVIHTCTEGGDEGEARNDRTSKREC